MKLPNAVTKAMMDWMEDGEDKVSFDMREMLRRLFGSHEPGKVTDALRTATMATIVWDLKAGGKSVLAMPLLVAALSDIDWAAVAERYRSCPELN